MEEGPAASVLNPDAADAVVERRRDTLAARMVALRRTSEAMSDCVKS